jgi:Domain of unknown function (DUF4352)
VYPDPRRRPGRTIALVTALVLLGCCVAGTVASLLSKAFSGNAFSSNAAVGAPAADGARRAPVVDPTPALNVPVRDGKFEFVITAFSCGQRSLHNGFLAANAQGQFCVARMSVANIGTEPQRFADGLQKAYGPDGTSYAADTGAGVVANSNGDAIWNVVNPGNSITASVVFDIPPTASITVVEVHDSVFSRGTKVRVAP